MESRNALQPNHNCMNDVIKQVNWTAYFSVKLQLLLLAVDAQNGGLLNAAKLILWKSAFVIVCKWLDSFVVNLTRCLLWMQVAYCPVEP